MDHLLAKALAAAEQFVHEHPTYTLRDQPTLWQGATNRVIRACHNGRPVIFKYFWDTERWRRECYGLRHFQPTGLTPQIIDDTHEKLVIMSELPHEPFPRRSHEERAADSFDTRTASESLGRATAALVQVPLTKQDALAFEHQFYEDINLEGYLRGIVQAALDVQACCCLYQRPIFQQSLILLQRCLPLWLAQPRILYHQDAGNVCFLNSNVSGFFDFEMCRVGTLSIQLGSLFGFFRTVPLRWREFCQSFEAGIGRSLEPAEVTAALGFGHFMIWRYATRYGQWHGRFATPEEGDNEARESPDYAACLAYCDALIQQC